MYTKESFLQDCMLAFGQTDGNRVVIPGRGDVRIYDTPLIAFADANDKLFEQYKQPEIIGDHYFTPAEWLTSAKTVISFFFPFTVEVRSSNRRDRTDPSQEWLYGRIEGQAFLAEYMTGLQQLLQGKGIDSCVPSQDERFGIQFEMTSSNGIADFHADSRWSERHAAYACGLGTFACPED